MNIPWKVKSRIFSLIDVLNANKFLYFLQKNVTKRSLITRLDINEDWLEHQAALIDNGCTGFVFEFGAGKNLAQNLYLSNVVDRQLVVDINPMIEIQLVDQSRSLLANKVKLKSCNQIKSLSDLRSYGIEYRAPYDATTTDLLDKTIDACLSTNTLEHIPCGSIKSIFNEIRRILKDTGIVSVKIDYTDHYAHTDSSISLLNYLKYSDSDWKKYNHSCHFQNRLRHSDYKLIFNECGFHVVCEKLFFAETNIPDDIRQKFENSDPSWFATSAHFVLKKLFL